MPDGSRVSQRSAVGSAGVLVIDDDPSLLRSFMDVLHSYGIPIATARDGYEALAAFRWSPPAVVLTDILMREQCATAMAMRQTRSDIKIVAMSDDSRMDKFNYLKLAKRFSVDAIVHKPFEVFELVKLLRTFARSRPRV